MTPVAHLHVTPCGDNDRRGGGHGQDQTKRTLPMREREDPRRNGAAMGTTRPSRSTVSLPSSAKAWFLT